MDRWRHRSPDAAAIGDLLLALKTTAECYLGAPVPVADIVTAVLLPANRRRTLQSATSHASLKRALIVRGAGSLAAMGTGVSPLSYQPGRWPIGHDARPQLVLTVDYSRAALTATLYHEEDTLFDILRTYHNESLGASASRKCEETPDSGDCSVDLAHAIEEVIKLPAGYSEVDLYTEQVALLLPDEEGNDPGLLGALTDALGESVVAEALDKSHGIESRRVDPAFAAARGTAKVSWEMQNDAYWPAPSNEL